MLITFYFFSSLWLNLQTSVGIVVDDIQDIIGLYLCTCATIRPTPFSARISHTLETT